MIDLNKDLNDELKVDSDKTVPLDDRLSYSEEKLICEKCHNLGYDVNRSSGERIPMCNCFPVYRMIENISLQPEWCPKKEIDEFDENAIAKEAERAEQREKMNALLIKMESLIETIKTLRLNGATYEQIDEVREEHRQAMSEYVAIIKNKI